MRRPSPLLPYPRRPRPLVTGLLGLGLLGLGLLGACLLGMGVRPGLLPLAPAWAADDKPDEKPGEKPDEKAGEKPTARPVGDWYLFTAFRGQEMSAHLVIVRAADGTLTGTYTDEMTGRSELQDLSYRDDILQFTRRGGERKIGFRGTIEGDVLTGRHLFGALRIPTEGRRGKQAFDAFLAARRKADERTGDLEADYDRHVQRVVDRDAFPVLFDPPMAPVSKAFGILEDEPVIGVAIGGEAKAYPISIMGVHELVNDTLGGTAIAVSW